MDTSVGSCCRGEWWRGWGVSESEKNGNKID